MGRAFAATIKLNDKMEPELDFGQPRAGEDDEVETIDFPAEQRLGSCPKCASGVFEHGAAYVCEKSVGTARTCDFRSGTIILQQPVDPEQMKKLLAEGRTDLLKGFISNRTRRKFSAYLVVQDGKVGFEFEKKAPARRPAAKKTPA